MALFLQAIIDEVHRRPELGGITSGVTRVRHDSDELRWPPAGSHKGDILVRWLAYADDICILSESKTQLTAVLKVFNDVLTEYGMVVSAEKSFWMTQGHSVDISERCNSTIMTLWPSQVH